MLPHMEIKGGEIFANGIKLRILTWGDYPALSRWTLNAITYVEQRWQSEDRAERFEDAGLEGWKDAATNQGLLAAPRKWKRQGRGSVVLPTPCLRLLSPRIGREQISAVVSPPGWGSL